MTTADAPNLNRDDTDLEPTDMGITTSSRRSGQTLPRSWQLDLRRSSIEFRVGLLWGLVTVKGRFESYGGQLNLSANPAIVLSIDVASVQTGNRRRDRHLRSADFFDVENHPQIRFCSDAVDLHGDSLKVSGQLSARGRSIPLELNASVRWLDGELELEAATTAPHRELGITWSPVGIVAPRSKLLIKAYLIPTPDSAA
jgi:polyisoprenoid-binding protein YceI